jgi:hypothetical protein
MICMFMCVHCILSLYLILVDGPLISEVVLSQLVIRARLG